MIKTRIVERNGRKYEQIDWPNNEIWEREYSEDWFGKLDQGPLWYLVM